MGLKSEFSNAVQNLLQEPSYEGVVVNIFDSIGQATLLEKRMLSDMIQDMIDLDASHSVTGVYCKGNIFSRPDNIFIVVNESKILVNISDRQVIVLESGAIDIEFNFLIAMINQVNEAFIFATGPRIKELKEKISYDATCKNIVYQLTKFNLPEFASGIQIIRLDDAENGLEGEKILDYAEEVWGYTSLKSLGNPHVIAIKDGKLAGGARSNQIAGKMAIVGGVKTFKEFRSKGIGTAVSASLVSILVEMGLHVYLETDTDNFPAQRIYEKIGFVRVGSSVFLDKGTSVIQDAIIGDRDY